MIARIWLISSLFFATPALAFPEMIRHGYVQCTACHFSPSGGAALTPYGRQLSGELMSTWSRPGEGLILHGAVGEAGMNKGIHFGGDIRSVQVHRENWREKMGRYFLMQAQVEALYQTSRFLVSLTIGEVERPMDPVFRGNLNAPRYYVLAQATDEIAIRAGRFHPQFGLRLPDHTLFTKNLLGFTPGLQRDSLEASYLGESWTGYLAFSETIAATALSQKEKAASVTLAYSPNSRMKVGVQHWHGQRTAQTRQINGLFANLGWSHRFFSLFEMNWQRVDSVRTEVGMLRTGYEWTKGVIPYGQYQYSRISSVSGHTDAFSLGFQFLPRPHFEVNGQWTRVQAPTENSDQAYLLLHYYL